MKSRYLTTLLALLLAAGLLLGCTPKETPAPAVRAETVTTSAQASAVTAEAVAASTQTPAATAFAAGPSTETPAATAVRVDPSPAGTAEAVPEMDGIDRLLEMRSVKITLTIDREGDGLRELAAEIDADGNQHILNTSTGAESDLPEEMYVGFEAVQHEILVIDGQAYRKDGEEGAWTPAPELNDYLERSLRGSEGPGLWLKLLEGGTRETHGDHDTLTVQVDIETVTGDVWMDPDSGALVGAKLEVPGVLYTHSNGGVHYPVMIEMKVDPAQVEPVILP